MTSAIKTSAIELKQLFLEWGSYHFQTNYMNLTEPSAYSDIERNLLINKVVIPTLLLTDEHKRAAEYSNKRLTNFLYIMSREAIQSEIKFRKQLHKVFPDDFAKKAYTSKYPLAASNENAQRICNNCNILLDNPAYVRICQDKKTGNIDNTWKKKWDKDINIIIIRLHIRGEKIGHLLGAVILNNIIDIFDPNGRTTVPFLLKSNDAEKIIGDIIVDHIIEMGGPVMTHNAPLNRINFNAPMHGKGQCTCWTVFMLDCFQQSKSKSIYNIILLWKTIPLHVFKSIVMNYSAWIFKNLKT